MWYRCDVRIFKRVYGKIDGDVAHPYGFASGCFDCSIRECAQHMFRKNSHDKQTKMTNRASLTVSF